MKSRGSFSFWAVLFCAAIVFIGTLPQLPVRADIGWPPVNPAGSGPGIPQGFTTNVRMVSETVDLTVEEFQRPIPAAWEDSPGYWMRGQVEAQFQMRNLGQEAESFDVWFPLSTSTRYPGLLAYTPDKQIENFKVWVDGSPGAVETVQAPDLGDPQQESSWARFPVTFPAGQDVNIRISYSVYPSGRRPFGDFEYILQTGAGWKDSIGSAVITIYLPFPVTKETVSLSGRSIEGLSIQPQPDGYTVDNNTVRWQLTDFEPSAEDNIYINVLEPGRYRSLQQARAQAVSNPDSADAQLELAKAVKNAVMVLKGIGKHGGGPELAQEVNAAYQRALDLAPQRVEIYNQYADWLMLTVGWGSLLREAKCPAELCDLITRGLEAFPNDPGLNKMDQDIRQSIQENAPYATEAALKRTATAQNMLSQTAAAQTTAAPATLTASPLPPSSTPNPPAATATPVPATPTAASSSPGQVCPAIGLPLAFSLLLPALTRLRRRKS